MNESSEDDLSNEIHHCPKNSNASGNHKTDNSDEENNK